MKTDENKWNVCERQCSCGNCLASGTIGLACTEEGTVFLWELREPGSQSACCCSDVAVKGKEVVGVENEFDGKGVVGMENEFNVVGVEDDDGGMIMDVELDGGNLALDA